MWQYLHELLGLVPLSPSNQLPNFCSTGGIYCGSSSPSAAPVSLVGLYILGIDLQLQNSCCEPFNWHHINIRKTMQTQRADLTVIVSYLAIDDC